MRLDLKTSLKTASPEKGRGGTWLGRAGRCRSKFKNKKDAGRVRSHR
jgi:hypothetical protein